MKKEFTKKELTLAGAYLVAVFAAAAQNASNVMEMYRGPNYLEYQEVTNAQGGESAKFWNGCG